MSQINHYADVAAFNEACGVYRVKTFGDPLPPEELAMRRRLVTEEWHELKDAIAANDRVEIADACADLAYAERQCAVIDELKAMIQSQSVQISSLKRDIADRDADPEPDD